MESSHLGKVTTCKVATCKVATCKVAIWEVDTWEVDTWAVDTFELDTWEVDTWEDTLGKLTLGKLTLGKLTIWKLTLKKLTQLGINFFDAKYISMVLTNSPITIWIKSVANLVVIGHPNKQVEIKTRCFAGSFPYLRIL